MRVDEERVTTSKGGSCFVSVLLKARLISLILRLIQVPQYNYPQVMLQLKSILKSHPRRNDGDMRIIITF